jgi:hypothetical protein
MFDAKIASRYLFGAWGGNSEIASAEAKTARGHRRKSYLFVELFDTERFHDLSSKQTNPGTAFKKRVRSYRGAGYTSGGGP